MTRELTWELACGRPPVDSLELDEVWVYYRNDQEVGFGVGLRQKLGFENTLEVGLHRAFNTYKQAWDAADEAKRAEMLVTYAAQVEDAARQGRSQRSYPEIILIMNVMWLVYYAGMPDDEYNGLQFLWTNGRVPSVIWNAV